MIPQNALGRQGWAVLKRRLSSIVSLHKVAHLVRGIAHQDSMSRSIGFEDKYLRLFKHTIVPKIVRLMRELHFISLSSRGHPCVDLEDKRIAGAKSRWAREEIIRQQLKDACRAASGLGLHRFCRHSLLSFLLYQVVSTNSEALFVHCWNEAKMHRLQKRQTRP